MGEGTENPATAGGTPLATLAPSRPSSEVAQSRTNQVAIGMPVSALLDPIALERPDLLPSRSTAGRGPGRAAT